MCGIAGYLDRRGATDAPVGRVLLEMLSALGERGPDSAGVALFSPVQDALTLRIKLGESGDLAARAAGIAAALERERIPVQRQEAFGPYLRLTVPAETSLQTLTDALESRTHDTRDSVEIISAGRCLEIVKQVGSPAELEASYGISSFRGTHGIGHTRLSTESRIDLSHSQPFWAHGYPDLAVVHNGHITNYHQLRRIYEQRGIRFYTENDSEIIGIYLAQRLQRGESLQEAMEASLRELDGSFCYLAAMPGTLAYAKDMYCLKPLVIAETDTWVAIATEEIALRKALGEGFRAWEPSGRTLRLWEQRTTLAAAA